MSEAVIRERSTPTENAFFPRKECENPNGEVKTADHISLHVQVGR
jgi:hypothetical protein